MFSYLRPNRRSPSNPPSPLPEQAPSWEGPLHPNADHGHPQRYPDLPPPERAAPAPPTQELQPQAPYLPPIERVTDTGYGTSLASAGGDLGLGTFEWEASTRVEVPEASNHSIETYTFQNRPKIPAAEVQRPESAGNAAPTRFANTQEARPRTGINNDYTSRPKLSEPIPQYPSSSDVQRKPVATGRRPAGARMKTPPPGSLDGPAHPLVSTFEPAPQKSGKTLNLLNPMSLFARRRTSQAVSHYNAEAVAARKAKNNDQLEFQIKGTVVHDFSAPRSRKTASSTDLRSQEASSRRPIPHQRSPDKQEGSPDESRWSAGDRTPVFTEDFEEEQYPAAGPHVRKASDLSDLTLPRLPYAQGSQKPVDQGPKKNALYQVQSAAKSSHRIHEPDVPPPVLPNSTSQSNPRRISIDPASTPPKKSPSSKGRSRNVSEASAKDFTAAGLPKHMKSTSSRFSFDMIGAAEQERLLEDRHRQKSLEKKASKIDALDDGDDDDFDYENMDEDDGLEERIPGVNADLEDDYEEDLAYIEEEIPGVNADPVEEEPVLEDQHNLAGLSFQQNMLTPLTPPTPGTATTPRDADGEVIGFAMSKNSPHLTTDSTAVSQLPTDAASSQPSTASDSTQVRPQLIEADYHQNNATGQMSSIDDDDLYFDDGMIDEIGQGDASVDFDESVFDNVDTDEYGRPLTPYSALPTLYAPPMLSQDPSPSIPRIPEDEELNDESAKPNHNATFVSQSTALAPHASVIGNNPLLGAPGLTQDSLAAYQSALAAAAFTAAANGKFHRDGSHENSPSEPDDSHPGLVTDSTHNSQYEPFSPSYGDDFDYDDALEDDAIIEAANKEALAYDTDGFYGQEFGFYSAPAAGEAEYTNGGYFGPPGGDGVNRSQSGRIVREPNLTPITERSEYSNRNSFMSLSHHGPSSLPGPGLAQLASLMGQSDYEGDLTLGALMKLRRGAWGGSQASLHSSTGSPRSAADDSSPVGHNPGWPQGPGGNLSAGGVHRNANSANSFMSEGYSGIDQDDESEVDPSPGSPTITVPIHAENPDEKSNKSPEKGSPTKNAGMRRHKHSNSADSISYLKEDDPHSPTGERWILERRRTSETGEELLNREVVSGGRI